MTVEMYALVCVVTSAALKIVQSSCMQQSANRSSVLIWYNILGGLLLLPFVSLNALSAVPGLAWALLFFAAVMWLLCDSFHLESMKYLSAADNEIISTLRVVLIALVGLILFQDQLSSSALLGMVIIVVSMVYNLDLSSLEFNKGTRLALIGAGCATLAISIDKVLLGFISPQIIVVFAFLIPGTILLLRRSQDAYKVLPTLKCVGFPLILAPVIGVIRYYCMVHAYSLGQLSSVTMILQATVFVVFLAELFLFRQSEKIMMKRGISSAGCAMGAVLVCL
jgi:drug/metabolite transporter (DMT)-like permease